jgi:hypothetical protein
MSKHRPFREKTRPTYYYITTKPKLVWWKRAFNWVSDVFKLLVKYE